MVIRKCSGAICSVGFITFLGNTHTDYVLVVAVLFFLKNSLTYGEIFLLIKLMTSVGKHPPHLNLYGLDLATNLK
jgi:hypothetical protein